jgi:uncharacterized membrane protein
MSAQSFEESNVPAQNRPEGSIWRGILNGMIPLALLLVVVVATLLLTDLTRPPIATSGFFTQQRVSLIILIAGLVLAIVIYIVALVLTLRRVASWQPGSAQARAALLALGATALIVVLPVLLAIVLPQSPAP